ncbi:CDP-glycerol glycerophosphotransferase family protein [Oceanobacillus sp. Castelsardo]|uniref:CDP-glycerol glycerophosphotransferase family protein n=1 Tax=Oceanobacillus sp. Castelsardo TaxID=1851204 RepID=UPI0008388E69|nr:CDP-glycerol glycerophosphotransferase family protein [Oceanobacillus sp. Castelsardo]
MILRWVKNRITKKKPKPKLKQKLNITQNANALHISGVFRREDFTAKELWLFSRDEEVKKYQIAEITPSNEFNFEVSLEKLMDLLKDNDGETFDWYFKVRTLYDSITHSRKESDDLKLVEINDVLYVEYFIRLGRFQETKVDGLEFYNQDDSSLMNYISTKGNLSVIVNAEPDTPIRLQIDKVKKNHQTLRLEGKIFSRNSNIQDGQIVLVGRDTDYHLTSSELTFHKLQEQVEKKYGLNRYTYVANINLKEMNQGKVLDDDVYDLFFNLNVHDKREPKMVRIGRPTFRARLFLRELYAKDKNEAMVINPYFTFKKFNLSFEVYKYPIDTYQYMRRVMRWSWLLRLKNRNKDIWLVGERTYKAQDTGYAFFRHMRENYPEKQVYYVIDPDSPEKRNVEKFGNVIDYRSKKHILYTLLAKKVISSHHPDYLYPIRTGTFKRRVKATKVFLQHGVMGTKNMVANYGKSAAGFDTDLFIVSSDFEKEMIVNDFGYHPKEVFVTGLSRFDTLFKKDIEIKRQILIIPTWRDWIVTDEVFLESEYYERYEQLINSPELHELSKKQNFEILFCLHPNMQKFSKFFENDAVKVINQGEVDVQHLIKESMLMITDYSSVGFDFSFLHKPVIYYQFDRSRFIGKRPSHLDLNNDLPGEICYESEEILGLLENYAKNDFAMKEKYIARANKFIKYRDTSASERIYEVVKNNEVKKRVIDNPKLDMLSKALFNKYRKSKYYFPTMKLFFKVGSKVIPVDPKLIVFESGIGKQFGDSPKNIYDEINRQDLDYKKVWIYNRNHRFNDPDTRRVKRLSPSYYYYLLRARYWVNNQNFPTYMKKRPETTYLQTWHGTPLKKMLFDIEEVHGRSDDYVERVGNAVKNWDYLISPSEYATEAFRSAFHYDGEVLEYGYPRNDIFYQDNKEEIASKVRNTLQIEEGKKVILYAPTFRDDQTSKKNKFTFDINMDLHKMKELLGDEYVILLRMHVVVSNKIRIDEELKGFVINASKYPDIQELQLLADVLITDYSSVMFDFANTGKPILFYTYDLDNYRDNLRGFYMDFENEAPGPLIYNTEEIIETVQDIETISTKYEKKYSQFQEKYCSLDDGFASKRVVDKIFKKK